MNYRDMSPETVLIGFSGGGGDMHVGTFVGYQQNPTYIIQTTEGHVHWAECLTRLATADETLDYWRNRALAAEAKNSNA